LGTFLDLWRKLDLWIARIEAGVLVVLALAIILGVFFQGILRVLFDHNPLGISEFSVQALVWVGFLSASLATHKRRHLVVDLIPQILSRRGSKKAEGYLRVGISLIAFFFLLYLLRAGWVYWQSPGVQFRTTTILQIPAKYISASLLWSLGMMSIRFLEQSMEELALTLGLYPQEKRWVSETLLDLKELLKPKGSAGGGQ
jgi:TRAP-type C4-dicarboxylate transport system permease small subunit